MSHQGGKSAAIFSAVFPNIIRSTNRYFQRIIKYLRSTLPPASNSQIHKSEIIQKIGYFPYGNDTYVEATKKIVFLGKTNPEDAIEILTTMNPFSNNPTLYNAFLDILGCASEESQVIQRFVQLSAMYIFSDVIPQVLSFATQKLNNSSLLDSVLQLINPNIDYLECKEPYKSVFAKHWNIIKKQSSVIVGLISIYSFNSVYPHFQALLKGINQSNASNVNLFRFTRIPPGSMRDHSFLVVDTIKHIRRQHDIMKPLISYLRYIVLQTDDSETINNVLVAKNYAMKFPEFKQHTTEIDAIITSKKPNLSIDNFIDFITQLFSDVQPNGAKKQHGNENIKPKVQLRCFLYLLRGSKFDESFFWRFGDVNGRFDESKEKNHMWNPTAPVSRIFSVFKPFFEKIDNPSDYLVSSIFENFALRNAEQTISTITLFLVNSSEYKNLVLLQTLSKIFNKYSDRINEFSDTTKTTLFSMLQKYNEILKNDNTLSTHVISPPVFLESHLMEINRDLNPNFIPEPGQILLKLVAQADEADFYIKKQLPGFEFHRCYLNCQQNIVRSRRTIDKIVIWLISLLSNFPMTINTTQFIQILLQLTMSSKVSIANYAFYTIEYLYFKINEIQKIIVDALLTELSTIENENSQGTNSSSKSASFLSLLDHLLKRKYPSQLPNNFHNRLTVVILVNLASPYIEVRILCLNLHQFLYHNSQITSNNVTPKKSVDNNDSNESETQKCCLNLDKIQMARIQAHFPDIKLPILKFEEVCESSCIFLYAIFYSELLINITNSFVINSLKSLDVCSLIKFSSKSATLNEDKMYFYQRKILLMVLHYRLYLITKTQYDSIQKDISNMSQLNYITNYAIKNPYLPTNNTNKEENDSLKKILQFLIKNIPNIHLNNPNLANDQYNENPWPFEFLLIFVNTASFYPLSIFISILSKQMKALSSISTISSDLPSTPFDGKSLIFIISIMSLLKNISQLPDIQLLFSTFPESFDSMKECFILFELFIKKICQTINNALLSDDNLSNSSSGSNSGAGASPNNFLNSASHYNKSNPNNNENSEASNAIIKKKLRQLITLYAIIIRNISCAITAPFDAGLSGSIRPYHPFEFTFHLNWSIDERFHSFNFFQKVVNEENLDEDISYIQNAVVALLKSGPVFRKSTDFKKSLLFIDSCLTHILQFHPFLFTQFAKESFSLNSPYFIAICNQYVGTKDEPLTSLTKREIKANIEAFSKKSILFLLASLFSKLENNTKEICVKLIRRIAMLTSALISPNDNSKIINVFNAKDEYVLESVFENFPFIASDVFIEGMNQIKIGVSSPVAAQIIDVLCRAALHIDLSCKSLSFTSHLVELYHSISHSFDIQYCKIFLNLCKNSETNRYNLLLSLFPLKRIEATKLILSVLVRHYPDEFLQRIILVTRFADWFYHKVLYTDLQSPYSLECCIYLMDNLCETHFSALAPHLIRILHFCLLFNNAIPGVSHLLFQLSSKMNVDYLNVKQQAPDQATSDNEGSQNDNEKNSNASVLEDTIQNEYQQQRDVDFSYTIPVFISYFSKEHQETSQANNKEIQRKNKDKKHTKKAQKENKGSENPKQNVIQEWEQIALTWFISCGDLPIAIRSGEIFSLLPTHKYEAIPYICRSIYSVISCPSLRKHSIIFKYPVCGFNMIYSILKSTKVPLKILEKVFTFLRAFLDSPDTKIICSIFKAFSVLIENEEMIEKMNLLELYHKVVLFLNPSNDSLVRAASLFLASVIVNVPDAKIRAVTFCLLLPVIYSSLSGGNLDNQTTNEILCTLTSAQLGGTLPSIIATFIDIRETPTVFLQKIINDLYVNHLSDIECIGGYYALMSNFEDASSVFDIALALFNVSDKDWFIENFIGVVKAACQHKGDGIKLLEAITANYRGAMFTWEGALKQNEKEKNQSTGNQFSFDKLIENLSEYIKSTPDKKRPVGEVTLDAYEASIPMIPIVRDSLKYFQETLNEIKQMIPQPLHSYSEDFQKLRHIKTVHIEPELSEQSISIFNKHTISIKEEGEYNTNNEQVPASFFIPENFDEFLKRIEL